MRVVRGAIIAVLIIVSNVSTIRAMTMPPSNVPLPASVDYQFDDGSSRDDMGYFLGPVLEDVNAYWAEVFAASDLPYAPVDWAIVESGWSAASHCGASVGDPADGPYAPAFYCPLGGEHISGVLFDPVIYLSAPWLFNAIAAVGAVDYDFAVATVAAHEVGHHVEQQLGYFGDDGSTCCGFTDKQIELAADCFAGNWSAAADAVGALDVGDISEAMAVTHMFGSDFPSPEGTAGDHGTREDRVNAWSLGFDSGSPDTCVSTYLPS